MGLFHYYQFTKMSYFRTLTLKAASDFEHSATQDRSEEAATQYKLSRPTNGIGIKGVMHPTAHELSSAFTMN